MAEIANPSERVYWIADTGTGFVSGETLPNQVTTFGADTGIFWQGHNRAEYELKCALLNIQPHDVVVE